MMQINVHVPFVKSLVRRCTESYFGLNGVVTSKKKRDMVEVLGAVAFSAESFT